MNAAINMTAGAENSQPVMVSPLILRSPGGLALPALAAPLGMTPIVIPLSCVVGTSGTEWSSTPYPNVFRG